MANNGAPVASISLSCPANKSIKHLYKASAPSRKSRANRAVRLRQPILLWLWLVVLVVVLLLLLLLLVVVVVVVLRLLLPPVMPLQQARDLDETPAVEASSAGCAAAPLRSQIFHTVFACVVPQLCSKIAPPVRCVYRFVLVVR